MKFATLATLGLIALVNTADVSVAEHESAETAAELSAEAEAELSAEAEDDTEAKLSNSKISFSVSHNDTMA